MGSAFAERCLFLLLQYQNTFFDDLVRSQRYKSQHHLYRHTRSIYNPTRRLVDFYAGHVYPGVLSEDGSRLPEGVPLAIPLSDDTPPALRKAIAQIWDWSRWQAGKHLMVRWGATTGSVLVEIIDEPERAKVFLKCVWPGYVKSIDLDHVGNIRTYETEYEVAGDEGKRHRFGKRVSKERFEYFKDGNPFDYGQGAVVENPYGFVPAAWAKHRDFGSPAGLPAIDGAMGKLDELNMLASMLSDQVSKLLAAPILIEGAQNQITNVLSPPKVGDEKRGSTADLDIPERDREGMLILGGPAGAKPHPLTGNIPISEVVGKLEKIIGEIEADFPEVTFYDSLRAMSQVTGPAAARLMGDVANRVLEAQANYDAASISLFRMAVAIAGWRVSNGDWRDAPRAKLFGQFNLDSYGRGDLEMSIAPRPIIQPIRGETIESLLLERQLGVTQRVALQKLGYQPDQIATMEAEATEKAAAAADRQAKIFSAGLDREPVDEAA